MILIRPTSRLVLLFAGGIPLALFIVIYDPALWPLSINLGVLVAIAGVSDALLALKPRALHARFELPERIFIGEAGAIVATLSAPGHRRTVAVDLIAEQQGEVEPPRIVPGIVDAGAEARIDLPVVPTRRGRIKVERVWMRWRGPLALVELGRQAAIEGSIPVLPNVRGVHGTALQLFVREAIYGIKTQQQKGEGTEFDALREYVPGLDSRFIDWKHSARHRKIICKEFRIERNNQVMFAFDTGYLMLEPVEGLTRLDHAINAALVLAWISLQGGDLVGTYGFDATVRHYARPQRGVSSFPRVQRATAELDYHHQEANFTLGLAELSSRLKRRTLVILFTDFVDTITAELLIESMQRMANRHLLLFVTQRGSVNCKAPSTRRRHGLLMWPRQWWRRTSCAIAASCSSGCSGSGSTVLTYQVARCRPH